MILLINKLLFVFAKFESSRNQCKLEGSKQQKSNFRCFFVDWGYVLSVVVLIIQAPLFLAQHIYKQMLFS